MICGYHYFWKHPYWFWTFSELLAREWLDPFWVGHSTSYVKRSGPFAGPFAWPNLWGRSTPGNTKGTRGFLQVFCFLFPFNPVVPRWMNGVFPKDSIGFLQQLKEAWIDCWDFLMIFVSGTNIWDLYGKTINPSSTAGGLQHHQQYDIALYMGVLKDYSDSQHGIYQYCHGKDQIIATWHLEGLETNTPSWLHFGG